MDTRRRRFARTFSRGRWAEYEQVLRAALSDGYRVRSLEDWLLDRTPHEPTVILRHDVDQHPAAALEMAAIEASLGLRSTWYFRWRTASWPVLHTIRAAGGQVGLHYETLTRLVRERGGDEVTEALVREARIELHEEIRAFVAAFGPIRSVCPHGDTRVPHVSNQILLEGQHGPDYGVLFDSNAAIKQHPLGLWLTDRSTADGRWKDGTEPLDVFREGRTPILLLTHPNNWCSGIDLWRDRLRAAALPVIAPGATGTPRFGIRTGTDAPARAPLHVPTPGNRPVSSTPVPTLDFAPVTRSLQREILRYYYDGGERIVDDSGLRTLATNAGLAESRAAMLEQLIAEAGVTSLVGRDLLDVGSGFGALALLFATRGARVTAIDPNTQRAEVGRTVATRHGLPVTWQGGLMQSMTLREETFDIAVMNNSLCYLVSTQDRREALSRTLRALRPGGVLVLRNPNRWHPRDQFSGIPFLNALPPAAAHRAGSVLRPGRSRVRLKGPRAAVRELRRAGFVDAHLADKPQTGALKRTFGGYQHLSARRPDPS